MVSSRLDLRFLLTNPINQRMIVTLRDISIGTR